MNTKSEKQKKKVNLCVYSYVYVTPLLSASSCPCADKGVGMSLRTSKREGEKQACTIRNC